MAVRVFFVDNQILIDGLPTPFVAGSLGATLNDGNVQITPNQGTYCLTAIPWQAVAAADGSTFPSSDAVMAYLAAQLGMRRSLDIPTVSAVASQPIAQGLPVAVSRGSGQIIVARADTYPSAFAIGLATEDCATGFVCSATRSPLTMADWTLVAGAAALTVGQPYFLAPAGGITLAPPTIATSVCSARVGHATGPQTFLYLQSDPHLL